MNRRKRAFRKQRPIFVSINFRDFFQNTKVAKKNLVRVKFSKNKVVQNAVNYELMHEKIDYNECFVIKTTAGSLEM